MTWQEVKSCILEWNRIRKGIEHADEVKSLFAGKIRFVCKDLPATDSDLHIYPGVDTGNNLVYFAIPAFYDSETYKDELENYIRLCTPVSDPANGEIDPKEALHRIQLWKDYSQCWIPQQLASEDGMYQAFWIPKDDLESTEYHVYFALKNADLSTNPLLPPFIADLIIDEGSGSAGLFFDTVRPVPPFKSSADRSSFYVLTLAGIGV